MASDKQIAANRLNAQKSTDPSTNQGKRRSRRNALRHGLTAESVVSALEDEAAYRKFERIILHDYAPDSAVERGLVVRLASLLWRLRRAVAIESGLFDIQGQIVRNRHQNADHHDPNDPLKVFYDLLRPHHERQLVDNIDLTAKDEAAHQCSPSQRADFRELTICFLRIENFNSGMLDLVGRYETRVWRQLAQTLLVLESMRQVPVSRRRTSAIKTSQFSAWR